MIVLRDRWLDMPIRIQRTACSFAVAAGEMIAVGFFDGAVILSPPSQFGLAFRGVWSTGICSIGYFVLFVAVEAGLLFFLRLLASHLSSPRRVGVLLVTLAGSFL